MIKGFKCPIDNKPKEFQECLECALEGAPCGIDYAVLKGMIEDLKKEKAISITSIISCLRKIVWYQTREIYVDPQSQYFLFRGQVFHRFLAEVIQDEAQVEIEWKKELQGFMVIGHPDIYYPRTKWLKDYKTTISVPKGIYPHHGLQINLYRMIGPEVNRLSLVYLSMKGIKEVNVPLLDIKLLENYSLNRIELLKEFLLDGNLPPATIFEWECRYCPFASECDNPDGVETPASIEPEELEDFFITYFLGR